MIVPHFMSSKIKKYNVTTGYHKSLFAVPRKSNRDTRDEDTKEMEISFNDLSRGLSAKER